MKAKENYEIRLQMAEMHEEFIERLSIAYDNNNYVEAVWICYAIFEQRVSRLIAKYIDKCTIPAREDDRTCSISVRIRCIKELINSQYGAFDGFNLKIMTKIEKWCKKRNALVHGLISLKHYKEYDKEFKDLAEEGVPLVFELYDACTDFRNRWYESEVQLEEFPKKTCQCSKMQCINPNCI